ncbi:MAG: hypothetical protein ACR2LL_04790 [Nitrosopumilus sp.]|uniref:hypothetical protein n=1 Tax=Nitrosopumilus sp. TaxID=2024843 RepID=UPI00292CEE3E|nr:hypothetical protein [Nitrosopumilus sp.]
MSLQEFDALIERMNMVFEYAENLGQYVDAAKILYQINDQLPENLQLVFEELDSPDHAKSFVRQQRSKIQNAVVEYRQILMISS